MKRILVIRKEIKGGAGSGHWAHTGLPGQVGGSRSGGGLRRIGVSRSSTAGERRTASEGYRSNRGGEGGSSKPSANGAYDGDGSITEKQREYAATLINSAKTTLEASIEKYESGETRNGAFMTVTQSQYSRDTAYNAADEFFNYGYKIKPEAKRRRKVEGEWVDGELYKPLQDTIANEHKDSLRFLTSIDVNKMSKQTASSFIDDMNQRGHVGIRYAALYGSTKMRPTANRYGDGGKDYFSDTYGRYYQETK